MVYSTRPSSRLTLFFYYRSCAKRQVRIRAISYATKKCERKLLLQKAFSRLLFILLRSYAYNKASYLSCAIANEKRGTASERSARDADIIKKYISFPLG